MQMTKELTVFKFNDKVIRRSNGVDGRILYCIADVCAALGIKKTNEVVNRLTRGAVNNASLSREDVGNNAPLSREEVENNASLAVNITLVDYPTTGGVQRMVYTDEVGLYDIIGKSRKPLAKILFRKLIEAVPAMRQERVATNVVPNLDLASIKALAQGIIGLTGHVEVIQTDVNLLKTDVALLKTAHESNALLPVVAYLGPVGAYILTGSFVIEKIFGIPGLGQWMVLSISNRDYSLILGLCLFISLVLVITVFAVDLICKLIDPRIKITGKRNEVGFI